MQTDSQDREIAAVARTLQIIVFALVMGPVMFAVIIFLLPREPEAIAAAEQAALISYMAAGAAALAVVAAFVVPGMIGVGQIPTGDARAEPAAMGEPDNGSRLLGLYQTRLIVRAAILEGAAFFNLVAYMLERQPYSLAAAIVLLLLVCVQFPTRSRLEDWLQDQRSTAASLRHLQ